MPTEGLTRLNTLNINRNRPDFVVMKYLIEDLKAVIPTYSKGMVLDVGCNVVQSDMKMVDVICPATSLDFENNAFDTVFSTQVIEHVGDPFKMLSKANRVLKNEGFIIVSAPFSWELHEEPCNFYRYSKYGLKAMFEKNGFEVVQIKANGGKWAAIFQLNMNMIYSTFKSKNLAVRLLKLLFINLRLTALINSIGIWLDKKNCDEVFTLNYVVVAKKVN